MEKSSSYQESPQTMKRFLNLKIPPKSGAPLRGPMTFSPSHTFSNIDSPIFYYPKPSPFMKKQESFAPPEIIQSPRLRESQTLSFDNLPTIPNTPPQHLYFNTANVLKTQQIEKQLQEARLKLEQVEKEEQQNLINQKGKWKLRIMQLIETHKSQLDENYSQNSNSYFYDSNDDLAPDELQIKVCSNGTAIATAPRPHNTPQLYSDKAELIQKQKQELIELNQASIEDLEKMKKEINDKTQPLKDKINELEQELLKLNPHADLHHQVTPQSSPSPGEAKQITRLSRIRLFF